MHENYFKGCCERLNIDITDHEISKFFIYKDLLISWNEKMNLTAIKDDEQIILKHFVDSLTVLKYVREDCSLIDVGTGAGFPGLPLKIMRSGINLSLLDSVGKRLNFLREAADRLELSGVEFIHQRAEDGGSQKQYRERYDIAVSRAVAPLASLCEYCIPFVKPGGIFIAMKGADAQEETLRAKSAIYLLGGSIREIDTFSLTENENRRTVIIIEKVKNTPRIYPRKAGTPAKTPL